MTHEVALETPEAQWKTHNPRVRSFLKRILRNPSDMEDCVSETSLAFLIAQKGRNPPRNPRSWVLQVAWNKAQDHLRRRARQPNVPLSRTIADSLVATEIDGEKLADLREWLNVAINGLPEAQRALLHLRYEEGMDYRSIGKVLSLPIGTVGRRLHGARQDLEASLRRVGRTQKLPCLAALLPLLAREPLPALASLSVGAAPQLVFNSAIWSGLIAMKKYSVVALAALLLIVSSYIAYQAIESNEPEQSTAWNAGAEPDRTLPDTQPPAAPKETPVKTVAFSEPMAEPGIRGRVVDEQGQGVANATVVMLPFTHNHVTELQLVAEEGDAESRRTQSDAEGRFHFGIEQSQAANRYDLHAQAADYAPTAESFVSPSDKEIRLTLKPGFEIMGQVVDTSENPVAEVEVSYHAILKGSHLQWATSSDASGHFRIRGVLSRSEIQGDLEHLSLSKSGFADRRYSLSAMLRFRAGDEPKAPLIIQLSRGFKLSGIVRDEITKSPIANAEVVAYGFQDSHGHQAHGARSFSLPFGSRIIARTTSDAEGHYEFNHLPVQAEGQPSHHLVVRPTAARGGVVAWSKGYSADGAGIPIFTHEPSHCVRDLSLRPAASVSGRVVDAHGKGIPGIRVSARPKLSKAAASKHSLPSTPPPPVWEVPGEDAPLGGSVTTDENGAYSLDNVRVSPTGETLIEVRGCGCRKNLGNTTKAEVMLGPNSSVQVKNLVLYVTPYGGKVIDPQGKPVANALVLPATGQAMRSGKDGRFSGFSSASVPRDEEHTSRFGTKIIADGFAHAEAMLTSGETDTVIQLTLGRCIRGSVKDSDGKALRDINIVAEPKVADAFPSRFTTSDESGQFQISGLPLTPLVLRARHGGLPDTESIELSAKQTYVNVVMPAASQLGTGRLRLLDLVTGKAYTAGAQCLATTEGGKSVIPTQSSQSVFSFGPLKPQVLKVRIYVAGLGWMKTDIEIKAGTTTDHKFEIDTRQSLVGTCHLAKGTATPLPKGIRVTANPTDRSELATTVSCASDGSFVFRGLKRGTYSISAAYMPMGAGPVFSTPRPELVQIGAQPAPRIQCELAPGHRVTWTLQFPETEARVNDPASIIAIRDLEGRWLHRQRRDHSRPLRSLVEIRSVLPEGPLRIDILHGRESLWNSDNLFPKRAKKLSLRVSEN